MSLSMGNTNEGIQLKWEKNFSTWTIQIKFTDFCAKRQDIRKVFASKIITQYCETLNSMVQCKLIHV